MTDFFCYSGASAVTYSNKAWSLGDRMIPTLADATSNVNVARRAVWKCTTAGTTTATPTWPAGPIVYGTTTVTQNGVVFTACRPGYDTDNTTFAWASATLYAHYVCLALVNNGAAGDRVGFASDHAESQSTINVVFNHPGTTTNPCFIRSLDRTKTPFASDSYLAGAQVTTTAAISITVNGTGGLEIAGVNLRAASGGSGAALNLCATAGPSIVTFRDCNLENNSTVSTGVINVGVLSAGAPAYVRFVNCWFKWNFSSSANTFFNIRSSTECEVEGGGILSGSGSPTSFSFAAIGSAGGAFGRLKMRGFDFSNFASGSILCAGGSRGGGGEVEFVNCKEPSAVSTISAAILTPAFTVSKTGCGTATTDASTVAERYTWCGSVKNDLTVYRSGGQSDGTTPRSQKMATNNFMPGYPVQGLETWLRPRYQSTTGSLTLTISFIVNGAAKLSDADIAVRALYLGSNTSPLGSWIDDLKANVLASSADQTTNSVAWSAPARQNTWSYSVGDAFTVASNPGRVFFITNSGTTAGSEPGGYATAVDGDTITDGTHTARAGWRQECSVTFTQQVAGAVAHRIDLFPANAVVYVDDRPVMT